MEFPGAGSGGQGFYIIGSNASAGENDEAGAGGLDEAGDQLTPCPGTWSHSGGQQTSAAKGDEGFKGVEGVLGADIEGAVKGDGQRPGGGDELSQCGDIDSALRRQRPDNNAGGTDGLAIIDIIDHLLDIVIVTDKVFE